MGKLNQLSGTGIDTFGTDDKMQFKIYPNPVLGKVNLEVYLPEKSKDSIDILNVCGHLQKVLTGFPKLQEEKG